MDFGYDLPFEESDAHYRASRTARGENGQPQHDERSVDYFLCGIGEMRLGKDRDDGARRRFDFAARLELERGGYPDALLFLAALGDRSTPERTEAAIAARADIFAPESINDLLWLLGVPVPLRHEGVSAMARDPYPPVLKDVLLRAWQEPKAHATALELLKAAKGRLGLP